jgi:hypothetical protein
MVAVSPWHPFGLTLVSRYMITAALGLSITIAMDCHLVILEHQGTDQESTSVFLGLFQYQPLVGDDQADTMYTRFGHWGFSKTEEEVSTLSCRAYPDDWNTADDWWTMARILVVIANSLGGILTLLYWASLWVPLLFDLDLHHVRCVVAATLTSVVLPSLLGISAWMVVQSSEFCNRVDGDSASSSHSYTASSGNNSTDEWLYEFAARDGTTTCRYDRVFFVALTALLWFLAGVGMCVGLWEQAQDFCVGDYFVDGGAPSGRIDDDENNHDGHTVVSEVDWHDEENLKAGGDVPENYDVVIQSDMNDEEPDKELEVEWVDKIVELDSAEDLEINVAEDSA